MAEKYETKVKIRNAKNFAKQYAIDFFKDKSANMTGKFNQENGQIFDDYSRLTTNYIVQGKKSAQISTVAIKQERSIQELKHVIHMGLNTINEVIE